ncbi:hypothetical protein BJ878DRAFT_510911 [Calycina marina]|uniref:Uncharacterized protein n=1 Tax=Calycina marina TaxID=1763456 RepID=A0A9P7Z0N4_9HELO|nr:hypothetical protein BJ878DRAFT_510911 [Calycina marina]
MTGPGAMVGFIVTGLLATISSNVFSLLDILDDRDHKLWQKRPAWRLKLMRFLKQIQYFSGDLCYKILCSGSTTTSLLPALFSLHWRTQSTMGRACSTLQSPPI